MSEVGVEIVKTDETEENKIKYLNINVSNSEVERNPDVVRLHSDAGTLEYIKQDCKFNEVFNKIRAELIQSIQNGTLKIENGNEELFRIIDKYIAETKDNEQEEEKE